MNTSVIKKPATAVIVAVTFLAVSVMLPFSVGAAAPGKSEAAMVAKPGSSSIVQIVLADDKEFDVLQAAVVKADLVNTLNGSRQFTVFAPTDAAFIKTLGVADEAAAIDAVNALPVDALTNILTYHVMSGRHTSTSVLARDSYRMLNGATLTKATLANAGINPVYKSASNGVIHVINSVLMQK